MLPPGRRHAVEAGAPLTFLLTPPTIYVLWTFALLIHHWTSIHLLVCDHVQDCTLTGSGQGEDDSHQVIEFGRNRIFLYDTKKCDEYPRQGVLCEI